MTTFPNKHCSEHRREIEVEGDQRRPKNTWKRDLEKEMWTAVSSKLTAGGRWRQQHKTELDGDR